MEEILNPGDLVTDGESICILVALPKEDGFSDILGLARMRYVHIINLFTGEVLAEYIEAGYNSLHRFEKFVPIKDRKKPFWVRVMEFLGLKSK